MRRSNAAEPLLPPQRRVCGGQDEQPEGCACPSRQSAELQRFRRACDLRACEADDDELDLEELAGAGPEAV